MKKLVAVLLVILIVASCCAFGACQSVCDKQGHKYYGSTCAECGKSICEEKGHKWMTDEDGNIVFYRCIYCNASACDQGKHTYEDGKCTKCGNTNCDKGFHAFEDGVCKWCGKSRCKAGAHEFDENNVCIWCEKFYCKVNGHYWSEGHCLICKKTSAFAWIYDIFEKPVTPDQDGDQEDNQGGTSDWNSTCPFGDGSHAWKNSKCIYCGAVLEGAESKNFWDAVGEGLLTLAFMLGITIGATLIYWLGAALNWSFVTWIAHGIMLLIAFGMFLVYHWIWGIVFLVIFGGAYLFLAVPLISQRYSYHGSNFY